MLDTDDYNVVKVSKNEMSQFLIDYCKDWDLHLVTDLISFDMGRSLIECTALETFDDPSVGIYCERVSPWFINVESLSDWLYLHREEVDEKMEEMYDDPAPAEAEDDGDYVPFITTKFEVFDADGNPIQRKYVDIRSHDPDRVEEQYVNSLFKERNMKLGDGFIIVTRNTHPGTTGHLGVKEISDEVATALLIPQKMTNYVYRRYPNGLVRY